MKIKYKQREEILKKFSNHEISLGRAAKELKISLYEMMDIAKERKVDWVGLTLEDIKRDLKTIKGFNEEN